MKNYPDRSEGKPGGSSLSFIPLEGEEGGQQVQAPSEQFMRPPQNTK